MDVVWSPGVALGEFIGSFMLALGIIFATAVAKRKAFGLDTPLKKRAFLAAVFTPLVTISILAAHEFGGHGFINPGIAFIAAMIEMKFKALPNVIGFELLGGVAAALVFLLSIWGFNKGNTDRLELKEVFKFNSQSPSKVIGSEWLANIFWLLPIAGLLMFTTAGTASVFELAFAAAMGLAVIVLVTNEWAGANLNPQVWLGEFIIKFIAQRKITKNELFSELLSLSQVILVGIASGAIAYGAAEISGIPHTLGFHPMSAVLAKN